MKDLIQKQIRSNLIFLLVIGLFYVVYHFILYCIDFNFIQNSDTGWYYKIVKDPLSFDSAIQPVYPVLVFILKFFINIFSITTASDNLLMILVNSLQLFFFLFVITRITSFFSENQIFISFTLLFILFPITFLSFSPRPNSLLYAIEFFLAFRLLKNSRLKGADYLLLSILPLIHKSSLFTIIFFFIVEILRERKVIYYYILSSTPTLLYIIAGSVYKHGDFFWWFKGYNETGYQFENLPFGGLMKILFVDFGMGNYVNFIQGLMVLFYVLMSLFLLIRELKKKNFYSLIFFATPIIIAASLPPNEINSVFNYSVLFAIGILYYNSSFVQKRIKYIFPLFAFFSIIWMVYAIHVLR